jgi:channel protein (hemolysin III family)
LLGVALILRSRGKTLRVIAISIYVSGVVFALSASGVFHLLEPATNARDVMQRIDHAGIFFLIAATYTPIHIIEFRGFMRWGILGAVWTAALCGVVAKAVFFNSIPEWISLLLYLGLGWAGLISAVVLFRVVGWQPLRPLIGGALAYTAGAVLEFFQQPVVVPGVLASHEIFHLFVLAGVAMHWIYIRRIAIQAPITDQYQ